MEPKNKKFKNYRAALSIFFIVFLTFCAFISLTGIVRTVYGLY